MRKFVDPLPAGGAPLFSQTANDVLQREIYIALDALTKGLLDPIGGMILDGGIVTNNGNGTFDITAGVAFIEDEIMQFASASNVTYPGAIYKDTPTIEQKTFADAVDKDFIREQKAIVGTSPSGVNIPIANPLNDNIYIKNWIGKGGDIKLINDARASEAASRPQFIGQVLQDGTLNQKYNAGGTWAVVKQGTGTYRLTKNGTALPVETPLQITCNDGSTTGVFAASYDSSSGDILTAPVTTGGLTDSAFTIVVYP